MNYANHFRSAARVIQNFIPGEFRDNRDGCYPPSGKPVPPQECGEILKALKRIGGRCKSVMVRMVFRLAKVSAR